MIDLLSSFLNKKVQIGRINEYNFKFYKLYVSLYSITVFINSIFIYISLQYLTFPTLNFLPFELRNV